MIISVVIFIQKEIPTVSKSIGFFIQESPCVYVTLFIYFHYGNPSVMYHPVNMAAIFMFVGHYVYRSFIYTYLESLHPRAPLPYNAVIMAYFFTTTNAIQQGGFFARLGHYPAAWTYCMLSRSVCCSNAGCTYLSSPCFSVYSIAPVFIFGCLLWLIGLSINIHSDSILRNLRTFNDPPHTYRIPRGGFYDLLRISNANFFGEVVEWGGFALATCSLVGLSMWFFVAVNIIARAQLAHKYYLAKFPGEYEKLGRTAVIPFLL